MKHKYLIDFDDKSNWIYELNNDSPTGERIEDIRGYIQPDVSGNRFYSMTGNVWHPLPDFLTPFHMHYRGYETFFIKSGSLELHAIGQQCRVGPGSIIHYQPYQAHGLRFLEKLEARGFFQNYDMIDTSEATALMVEYEPEARKRLMEERKLFPQGRDICECETLEYEKVPVEEMRAVRLPDHPLAKFMLDGITMKMMIPRWELGGLREIWRFELKEGFHAETVEFPSIRHLFYMTEGEVAFKIYDDEFIAKGDCMIDIPKTIKFSITAKTDAAIYDVGGLSCWYTFLHDYMAVKKNSPEKYNDSNYIAELKKRNSIQIMSFGHE